MLATGDAPYDRPADPRALGDARYPPPTPTGEARGIDLALEVGGARPVYGELVLDGAYKNGHNMNNGAIVFRIE